MGYIVTVEPAIEELNLYTFFLMTFYVFCHLDHYLPFLLFLLFCSLSSTLLLECCDQTPNLYFKVRGKEFCNEFPISPTSRGRNTLWN